MTSFLLIMVFYSFSQTPPDEFYKGLDLLNNNKAKAKQEFINACKKDSLFNGSFHFLGVIYLDENLIDSSIFCFKKSIDLNKENVNHTKEMTYVRLYDTYLKKLDFDNSFLIALEAFKLYPDNKTILQGLKDICLWSFYIKHNDLDSSYLASEIRDEYVVNSVPEEYLIIRKIRINDHYLIFNSQKLIKKKGVNYDIISCTLSKSEKSYDVKFRLNWDLDKDFGGKVANTDNVYSNSEFPIYERIGALLVSDSKIDITKEIEKLMK
jgi:hypothetical protein